MGKVAFICGATRSGTTLLGNLLDGHPNIFMLAVEPHILQYWNYHAQYNSTESYFSRDYLSSTDVIFLTDEIARNEYDRFIKGQVGADNYVKWERVDRSQFTERYLNVLKQEGISLRTVYRALFSGAMSFDQFSDEKSIFVEKRPFDNEAGAIQLSEAFPDARFIHVIRDPRTRYLSEKMKRVRKRLGIFTKQAARVNDKDFATGHAETTMASMELALLNKAILGEKYHLVRFEDLLSDPEGEMSKIASHLKIEFSNNFLRQTVGNKTQGAVSSLDWGMSSGIKDISSSRLDQFFKHTSSTERRILRLFTWDLAISFGYNLEPVEEVTIRYIWVPLKYERPEDYLRNRWQMMLKLRGRKSSILRSLHFRSIMNDFRRGAQIAD